MRLAIFLSLGLALMMAHCALALDGFSNPADEGEGGDEGSDGGSDAVDIGKPTADANPDSQSDANHAEAGCVQPVRVQATHVATSTADTNVLIVAMPAVQVAGDYVIVGVNYDPGCGSVQSVNDTMGNTYKQLVGAEARFGAGALETWGAASVVAASAGANTVAATFTQTCKFQNIKVVEYMGVESINAVEDSTSLAGGDGGSPNGTLTTTSAAILFAHTADQGAAIDAGAGWAPILIDEWSTLAQEEFVPAAGSYGVTYFPGGTENWVIQAVAMRTCQ